MSSNSQKDIISTKLEEINLLIRENQTEIELNLAL